MSDEQNRDHRCRTCEHWSAPYLPERWGQEPWACECPIPFFVTNAEENVGPMDGGRCLAYQYSYRRARLVKP